MSWSENVSSGVRWAFWDAARRPGQLDQSPEKVRAQSVTEAVVRDDRVQERRRVVQRGAA